MRAYRAAWVVPVAAPPIPDGVVVIDRGRVREVRFARPGEPCEDLGDAVVAPGFVDAHTHTEWSVLDGLLQPAPFAEWLGGLLDRTWGRDPEIRRVGARWGALRALTAGTTTIADSGPGGFGVEALASTGQRGAVFLEAFGREAGTRAARAARTIASQVAALADRAPERVRVGLAPHAPYSIGPSLWHALSREPSLAERPWTFHLAESPAELPAISGAEGPLADLFRERGFARPARWPGHGGSVERLLARWAPVSGLVAAHCVQVDAGGAAALARAGVHTAHCPRSNVHLRCGAAPIDLLRAAGVVVALGTDSPASGGDYDLRGEARACAAAMAAAGRKVPSSRELVEMMTVAGAEVLGMRGLVGALEAGAHADLVIISPPAAGWSSDDPYARILDSTARVQRVVIGGDEVVRGGRPVHVDSDAVGTAAAKAAGALC